MKMKWSLGLALLLVFLLTSPAMANTTVGSIARELICQCGCTMVLSNCTHAECAARDTMTTLIGQKLAQGEPPDQIIPYFVATYGEQVLASPPKRGFNLTAWLLPFAALLLGAGIICLALRQWLRRGRGSQPVTAAGEINQQYRYRLERELKEFGERGFR